MPAMTHEEYEQIRAGVMRRRAEVDAVASGRSGPRRFASVGEFMDFLDAHAVTQHASGGTVKADD
jgi:hypothetical protein